MHSPDEPILVLQVAPARIKDVGSNIVRLPGEGLERLGVEEGDPVAIESRAGILWARARAAHPDDEGIDAARVDAAGVECPEILDGDAVHIRPASVRPAREVEIATDTGIVETSESSLREALASAPTLLRGDTIDLELEADTKGFDVDVGVAGLSLVRVVGTKGDIQGARVRILSTVPDGPVRLAPETELRVRP